MKKNDPEERLRELEIEMNALSSSELESSEYKELLFRRGIENSLLTGIAVIDSSGKQVYVNPSFCKIVGRDEYELIGKHPPFIYWPPSEIDNINKALQRTVHSKAPLEGFDLIFSHKSGKLIPVNVLISSFSQDDNTTYWVANVTDISGRKKIEEKLQKSQVLLKSSIESQKDTIVFSLDREYKYLYFNKAHTDAMKFAYNVDIKPGINFLDCVTVEADRKFLKDTFDRSLRGESPSIVQTFGEVKVDYYEGYSNPIVDEKGEIIGCSNFARNVTQRIEQEKTLKESEIKLREIINQINDGIIVFDEQGNIIIWNNGAEKLSGLKADEVLNRSISDIHDQSSSASEGNKTLIENVIQGILTQQTSEAFNQIIESEIVNPNNGELKNIQSIVFPVKLKYSDLYCAVMRDTSEIKRYEKELLRLSEEKDKFYSTVAQYLYNPFNLFQNFTKTMAEELDTLSIREIQKMAVTLSKSATNLYSLLDNLLQYTRINLGNISFKPQKVNLKNQSCDSASILKPVLGTKNISINHFINDNVHVNADVFMLRTIFRNLITHVIKNTRNEGQITISAIRKGSLVTVSVLDNEVGINTEYVTKLFDITQVHSALGEAAEKGTILGLLLCKEFVNKHGGEIWVESDHDKGCTFKFTLPLFNED